MGEQSRDAVWFEAMYRRCAPHVMTYAQRRLRSAQDSEDVTVEVFATAWRRRDELPSPELPWLYATAANVIAHTTRAQQRRTRLDARITGQPVAGVAFEERLTGVMDARNTLAQGFAELSDDDQEVLRLWAWEGLDGAELAVALGCAPGAARTRLHRAKTRLRTAITTSEGGLG